MARIVAHLDMDAFFASVELLRYPQLRSEAVVIGGRSAESIETLAGLVLVHKAPESVPVHAFTQLSSYRGRGVITTATYPARAFGVGSGMGLMRAARLCPQAILLPADFEQYRAYSRRFKAIVARLGLPLEDRGIDEVYIEMRSCQNLLEAQILARKLQAEIGTELGLSCSIGLAPNKLLAKLASDLDKPRGLTVLQHEAVAERIWPLPVIRLQGIGPRSAERLKALGIHSIGELARSDPILLVGVFGARLATWLQAAAMGLDERPIVEHSEPVSMSRETTLDRDMHPVIDREALGTIFTALCNRLAEDLCARKRLCRALSVKLRNDQFKTITRDLSFAEPTDDARTIRKLAGQCLRRLPMGRRIRLLGVRASRLVARPDPEPISSRTPSDCS
jgi:DNA polymerase-4